MVFVFVLGPINRFRLYALFVIILQNMGSKCQTTTIAPTKFDEYFGRQQPNNSTHSNGILMITAIYMFASSRDCLALFSYHFGTYNKFIKFILSFELMFSRAWLFSLFLLRNGKKLIEQNSSRNGFYSFTS